MIAVMNWHQRITTSDGRIRWVKPFVVAATVIVVVEALYVLALTSVLNAPENVGIFGDMFGGLNALFSGLAFAGLFYTIYLQVTASIDARREQSESLRLVQEQVRLLGHEIETQQRRDRVEAGPFFKIVDNSYSGQLNLLLQNVGAAVICKDFKAVSEGTHVRDWYPSSLPPLEIFTAPTHLDSPARKECVFEMTVRDRWGAIRVFQLTLDRRTAPNRLDLVEIAGDVSSKQPATAG